MGGLLSVVIPTYNEAENVPVLIDRIARVLGSTPHEIIVADDDSPDRTWEAVERLSSRYPNLRCLRRTKDKGLYPAVLDAFGRSSGSRLAVIDADLQHDESVLPAMLDAMRRDKLALVIGSRYTPGGGIANWSPARRLLSKSVTFLVGAVLGRRVTDPLSGYFLIDREAYLELAPRLVPKGFKILMDILANLPSGARVGEVGYVFKPRQRGKSKLGLSVALDFVSSLCALAVRRCTRARS